MSSQIISFHRAATPWRMPLQCKRRFASSCLLSRLQTTLDPRQLMELYWQELQQLLGVEGLSWRSGSLSINVQFGVRARLLGAYQLQSGRQSLGELMLRRRAPFTEQEELLLEQVLNLLIQPLHNAMLYQQALMVARRDYLTGLGNRIALDEALEQELDLAHRHGIPLSLLLLDIDCFKHINDRYGHSAGDDVLCGVATALQGLARQSDLLFRYAGDEFVILMRQTDESGAYSVAERLRSGVEQELFHHGGQTIAVQLSIGLATVAPAETAGTLFDRADQALLAAKRAGRNQVRWAGPAKVDQRVI